MKDLSFEKIQRMVEDAFLINSETRERAANDLYFYWISHWTDEWRAAVPLQYQGQFDILRPAGRKIIGDLSANPIDATFQSIDGTDEKLGEFLEQLYRTDNRRNTAREAVDNAMNECVPCGIGGWRLITDYETDRMGDMKRIISREPIYEFNNTVIFDPQAKRIDKSDAKWACVLTSYTEEGYEELVEDLSGDEVEDENIPGNFVSPMTSTNGFWIAESGNVYVGEFYSRYKKKEKVSFYRDMFGGTTAYYDEQVKGMEQDLKDAGYRKIDSKTIERWCVKKYIVSGKGILDVQEIAGTEIPIVPMYGERAFVNGIEHYEGITRCAKDPQLLRDFQMSYLADIVSTSPRPKPIFDPEEIAGFEWMYEAAGADNNLPYYFKRRYDSAGREFQKGIETMPEQPIPTALITSIELTKESVQDIAKSGAPNSIAETNLSGNAISQIKSMLDEQSIVYQQHKEFALRRDAEIYAGMVPDVINTPRKVMLTLPNGQQKEGFVMQSIVDLETGEHKVLNDMRDAKFDVFVEIGTPYESQKQQNRQELMQLMSSISPDQPIYNVLMLKYLGLGAGMDMDDIRKYAHKQLILQGITEPETDEDKQVLADAQAAQGEQQDPNMVLAQAEVMRAQQDAVTNQINAFKAETERMSVQIKAQEAGANIDLKEAQKLSHQIDNMQKLRNPNLSAAM